MATHAGDIFFEAKLDDKPYKKGLSNLEKQTSQIGNKIAKALTVTAIATGITKLINQTATLGDTIDKTSQKLGMSNRAYQEWGYIMARNGASIDSMTVAMKTLASSVETGKDALAELGITQEEAMGMSQEKLFERVIYALQGVEDKTRRTYLAGQLLGRGATELGAVLNLTTEDMARLRNRLTEIGGLMSDTAVQNSARFKDALYDVRMAFRGIANTLAEYVLPVLTNALNNVIIPAIQALSNAIRTLFQWLSSIGSVLKRGIGAVKEIVGKSTQEDAEDASKAIGGVGDATANVGNNAKGAKKQVQALKRELMGFDQITKLTKQDSNTGTTGSSGVGGSGLGDISGTAEDTNALADALERLKNITLPQPLVDALDHLKSALTSLFNVIKDAGKWAWDNVIKPLGEWLLNKLLPPAVDALASAIDIIVLALKWLAEALKPLWENILKPVFKWLGNIAVKTLETLAKNLKTAYEKLTDLKKKWDGFKSKAKELTLKIKDKFSSKWKDIKEKWKNVLSKFKDKTATLKLSISDKVTGAWKKIKDIWNSLKDKSATITLGLKNLLTSAWNRIATAVNNARQKSELVRTLFKENLPTFAQGGYVKANSPQLAIVGDNKREPEYIAPESKLEAMARMVAEGSNAQVVALLSQILVAINNKDTDVYLDGEKIKNNTVKRINQNTMSTGKLELIV